MLTNDGLDGLPQGRRQRRHPARARSRRLASRPRPTAAARTASSCARASATRPARSCGRRTSAARSSARSTCSGGSLYGPYYAHIVGAPSVPGRSEAVVRPLAGDRDRPRLEHGHLPPHLARPRLPLRARAPVGLRGARRDAAPSARVRCPPPARTRSPSRSEARHPARPQPEVPRVVAGGTAERLPGRDRRALRRLAGRARRRRSCAARPISPRRDRQPVAGRARRRADAASQASSSSTRGRVTYFIALNTRVAPFDDVRARRALNFAVDRRRLLDLTLGPGLGQVTCQVLPPDFDGYRRYCPYTAEPSASGAWTAPDLAARAAARARLGHSRPGRHGLDAAKAHLRQPPAGRYVVSVLDSLGYKARLRFAADPSQSRQARPPARSSAAGTRTIAAHRPASSCRRSPAAPTTR